MALSGNEKNIDNSDAPDFVKDIKNKSVPMDMEIPFVPSNPFEMTTGSTSLGMAPRESLEQQPSFLKTAESEAYEFNSPWKLGHAYFEKSQQPSATDDPVPSGWTPKQEVQNFINVRPESMAYLLQATGPKDQQYRLQRVYEEQDRQDSLDNGSWLARIIGGAAGVITDATSYIPVVGWTKYAKVAPTFFKSAFQAAPGLAAYFTINSGATQLDKTTGNINDFLMDSFTNTVFSTAIFGLGGVVAQSVEKGNLWNTRKLAQNYCDGIDYKFDTDDAGKIIGLKAIDTTGSLSAAKVSYAQDLANSSFSKMGIFKIPYVGAGVEKFLDARIPGTQLYFGSQLHSLLSSPFKSVRAIVDRIADHSIITKGVEEGKAAPDRFDSLMQQSMSSVRLIDSQLTALHLERNGFDISNRIVGGLVGKALYLQDKGLGLLGKDLGKTDYTSKEQFYSEIENVLFSEEPSQHAPVNEAASLVRSHLDEVYRYFRRSRNLPENWRPPKTARGFLMRVYDTPYLNNHENEWISVVGNWLREGDETIKSRMAPINDLERKIASHTGSPQELKAMKSAKKGMQEDLQNELRNNPDLELHIDDHDALSADEADEIIQLTKPRDLAMKKFNDHEELVTEIKNKIVKARSSKSKSIAQKIKKLESDLTKQEEKLSELKSKHEEEIDKLQEQMHNGEVSPQLFTKKADSFIYELKDPANRLKFRALYGSKENPITPEMHAKAYYDTILNQTPEQTINQVMGKYTGNARENPLKARTLMLPDSILYENKFMTKDLTSKIANYTSYLARRTHIKNIFKDVSSDGGFEPVLAEVNKEHEQIRQALNQRKKDATNPKEIKKIDKELANKRKQFDDATSNLNHLYEKMMGIKNYSKGAERARSIIMSLTSIASLPFVVFTQINDLAAVAMQHGTWAFIRDGIYPTINHLATLMRGKDSEAFRKTAPSINLALQDVGNGYADRNWGMYTNPYFNMGKIENGLNKVAHMSSNFTLTNYIDNGLQRLSGSVIQSELMRILHAFKEGTMSKADGLYIRKYGIDPEKWADRMISAFEEHGGGKTALGGYQTLFHQWHDLEAANKFGSSVYRGVKDTILQAGIADSPFWSDSPLGSIIKGFNGWMYASVNHFLIPFMQQPDASKMIGMLWMFGSGALIDPMRRMARGEDAYPENQTDAQKMYIAFTNSGLFSLFSTALSDANVLTNNKLLGNLRSDKYKDRTRAGLLGPAASTFNNLADIITAAGSGEWNKSDMTKAARMVPFANASWTYWMSKRLIDGMGIPENRSQARAAKE